MDFLRKIVSGPKNRFKEDGYNLDLTYVCTRLIAMSYPASGVESVYRNPIDKVTKFIRERHSNNFLVFNLSCRMYDYSKFSNQVLDFQWEDHHSPPIHTLFQICQKIQFFLFAKSENVCIIHCLAGKGRTGTIICCFLIYSGLIQSPTEALHYYAKKRFIKQGFGVNQPCQIRYLQYFYEVLLNRLKLPIYPKLVYIKKIVFHGRPNFNAQKGCRPYFDIIYVRTKHLIFSTRKAASEGNSRFENGNEFEIPFAQHVGISGDLLIRIKHLGQLKNQKMARISINTAFIPDKAEGQQNRDQQINEGAFLRFKLEELSPSSLLKDSRFPKDLTIEIHFGSFCSCTRHTAFIDKCSICGPQLLKERDTWEIMQRIIRNYQPLDKRDQRNMLFGNPNEDDVDLVLNSKTPLSRGFKKEKEKQDQRYLNCCCFCNVGGGNVGQSNRYKFDCAQDRFVVQTGAGDEKQHTDKEDDVIIDRIGGGGDNKLEQSIKIRERSDMRHNIYSDETNSYSASNHMRQLNSPDKRLVKGDQEDCYQELKRNDYQGGAELRMKKKEDEQQQKYDYSNETEEKEEEDMFVLDEAGGDIPNGYGNVVSFNGNSNERGQIDGAGMEEYEKNLIPNKNKIPSQVDEEEEEEEDKEDDDSEDDDDDDNNNNYGSDDSELDRDNSDQMNEGMQYCSQQPAITSNNVLSNNNNNTCSRDSICSNPNNNNYTRASGNPSGSLIVTQTQQQTSQYANTVPNTLANQHFNSSTKKTNGNNNIQHNTTNNIISSNVHLIGDDHVIVATDHHNHHNHDTRSRQKLVCQDTNPLDEDIEVENDDDPSPQKPFQGEHIFANRSKH